MTYKFLKHTKTLLLATVFACTNLTAAQAVEDMGGATRYIQKMVVQVSGRTQRDLDTWQNNYEKNVKTWSEAVSYIKRLSITSPEEAGFLLAGGKYGLYNAPLTDADRKNLSDARSNIVKKEAEAIAANQPGFLKNLYTDDLNSKRVIRCIYDEINRQEKRITDLEREGRGLNSTINDLNTRVAKLEKDLDLEKKARETDKNNFLARIAKLESSDYSAHEEIHKLQLELAKKTTKTDVSELFQKQLDNFKKAAADKELENQKNNETQLLRMQQLADDKIAEEKRIAAQALKEKAVAEKEKEAALEREKLKDASYDLNLQIVRIETRLESALDQLAGSKEKNETLEQKIEKLKADLFERNGLLKNLKERLAACDTCKNYVDSIHEILTK